MSPTEVLKEFTIQQASAKLVKPSYSRDYLAILQTLSLYWGPLDPNRVCFLENLTNTGIPGVGKDVIRAALTEARLMRRLLLVFSFSRFVVNDLSMSGDRQKYEAAYADLYGRARQEMQTKQVSTSHYETVQQKLKNYYLKDGLFRETPLRWVLVEKV